MNKSWEVRKLGEVIKLEYGKPLPDDKRNPSGAYPVYGANGEKGRTNECYHNKETIIVGRKGSAGELNLTEEKFWPLDVTYFVTFDEKKYDLVFLYHLLSLLELPKLAKGVKPGINRNEVYSIIVQIPPLPEQQRIVSILNKTFASIAKAKSNAEQNLKNAKELFESYKNELFLNKGKGYDTKELREVCDKITQGPNPKYDKYGDDKFRVLKTKNLYDNNIFYDESDRVSESVFKSCLPSELKNGDVLLAIVGQGSINKCNVFENKTLFRFIYTRALGLIRVKKSVLNPYYLKAYLQSRSGKNLIDSGIGGTSGQQVVTTTFIKSLKIPFPSLKDQLIIVQKLDALSSETKKLETIYQQKLNDLEELKKSILQKAFNGCLNYDSCDSYDYNEKQK
jgi:type I restriction enzyme S subunit